MSIKSSHFLAKMMAEAESYSDIVNIEKLVEKGMNLANIPIQPLYLAIKGLPGTQVGQYLGLLSAQQRELFLDLDLWSKDDLDPNQFQFWIDAYYQCPDDEIKKEFVSSTEFGLFLKSRFNIWTFDFEDPIYPDHDYYFLTEDNQLLFEYDESFSLVDEAKQLTRELYYHLGVERAYQHIIKFISEDYMPLLEEEYRLKNHRLVDAGFVDYYESLKVLNPHISFDVMVNRLKQIEPLTPDLDEMAQNQVLPKNSLVSFNKNIISIESELDKLEDQKRQRFLQFNFIRLMNAQMSQTESLRDGSVAISKNAVEVRTKIILGISFIKDYLIKKDIVNIKNTDSIFGHYDFCEIYRIGHSLIYWEQKRLKKSFKEQNIDESAGFLGAFIDSIIEGLFDTPSKLSRELDGKDQIDSFKEYLELKKYISLLTDLMPFIKTIENSFTSLKDTAQLHDHFYLNYNVDDIDFESIVLSSFANSFLKLHNLAPTSDDKVKLGLTLKEFKIFAFEINSRTQNMKNLDALQDEVDYFSKHYGLEDVESLKDYLTKLLVIHLEGYEFDTLDESEFKHVGGPIILCLS